MAREVISGIELTSSRRRALGEVCKRLASVAEFTEAERTAAMIDSLDERSSAYMELALEPSQISCVICPGAAIG